MSYEGMLPMELKTKHVSLQSNSRGLKNSWAYCITLQYIALDFTGDCIHEANAEMSLVHSLCMKDVPCFAAISHEAPKKGQCLATNKHPLTLWATLNHNTVSYKSPPKHGFAVYILSTNNRVCDCNTTAHSSLKVRRGLLSGMLISIQQGSVAEPAQRCSHSGGPWRHIKLFPGNQRLWLQPFPQQSRGLRSRQWMRHSTGMSWTGTAGRLLGRQSVLPAGNH